MLTLNSLETGTKYSYDAPGLRCSPLAASEKNSFLSRRINMVSEPERGCMNFISQSIKRETAVSVLCAARGDIVFVTKKITEGIKHNRGE